MGPLTFLACTIIGVDREPKNILYPTSQLSPSRLFSFSICGTAKISFTLNGKGLNDGPRYCANIQLLSLIQWNVHCIFLLISNQDSAHPQLDSQPKYSLLSTQESHKRLCGRATQVPTVQIKRNGWILPKGQYHLRPEAHRGLKPLIDMFILHGSIVPC